MRVSLNSVVKVRDDFWPKQKTILIYENQIQSGWQSP